ncbi:MAG: methyltransferase [Atribacterota bacterium]|nr:methyltransferase [Atribacterota bacterium]
MPKINLQPAEIIESLGKYQLKVIQDKSSYCFSIDSILLSQFVKVKNREKIIDLGTGCGIIPLLIYHPQKNNIIYGVEIQEKLASLAKRNVSLNNLENQIYILQDNINTLKEKFTGESFDVAIANPPFLPSGRGKSSSQKEQLIARHEINMNLESLVLIANYLLKKGGRLYLIHRADIFIPVIMILKRYYLEPKVLQFIYTKKDIPAKRFLMEARKEGGTELKVLTPLFLNQ